MTVELTSTMMFCGRNVRTSGLITVRWAEVLAMPNWFCARHSYRPSCILVNCATNKFPLGRVQYVIGHYKVLSHFNLTNSRWKKKLGVKLTAGSPVVGSIVLTIGARAVPWKNQVMIGLGAASGWQVMTALWPTMPSTGTIGFF